MSTRITEKLNTRLSVKDELDKIVSELSKLSSTQTSDHGRNLLKQKCDVKIKEANEHQLSYMGSSRVS